MQIQEIVNLFLPKGTDDLVKTGFALTFNPLAEFAITVKKQMSEVKDTTLALPFFPENAQHMLERMVSKFSRLPDLHKNYGHCFGADPWISIITDRHENKKNPKTLYLPCSFAMNGYHCLAHVHVPTSALLTITKPPIASGAYR